MPTPSKRPKTIILLLIIFIWYVLKDISMIFRYDTSLDFALYNHVGLTFVFFAALVITLTFHVITTWYLWKPKLIGLKIAYAGLGFSAIYNTIITIISANNLDITKDAYMISRETRGLENMQEALDLIFSPAVMYTSLGVSLLSLVVIAYLFYSRRDYFTKSKQHNP